MSSLGWLFLAVIPWLPWLPFGPVRSLDGVVDRVEGDFLVVEWRDRSLSDLPRSFVEGEVLEGQSICIDAWVDGDGAWTAVGEVLQGPDGARPSLLPAPPLVEAGRRYAVHFALPCDRPPRLARLQH
jgi:hypothetical protein